MFCLIEVLFVIVNWKLEKVSLKFNGTYPDGSNQMKMYFTFNLVFVNYFDNWTDFIIPMVNFDITEMTR